MQEQLTLLLDSLDRGDITIQESNEHDNNTTIGKPDVIEREHLIVTSFWRRRLILHGDDNE